MFELSEAYLVHICSIAIAWHALTQRSKGRSRSHCFENHHGRMVASDVWCVLLGHVLLLPAWVGMLIWLPMLS